MSVKICSGTPWAANAAVSASHTGRAVARRTTDAQTTNREWSSMPVTTFTSLPSDRVHAAHHVHLPQLHRPAPLPPPIVGALAAALDRVDQPVADQRSIHRRAARQRQHLLPRQLTQDPVRPQPECSHRSAITRTSAAAGS
jgi:hypothetical protein